MKRLAVPAGLLVEALTGAGGGFVAARAAVAAGGLVWSASVCWHPASPGTVTARAAATTNDAVRPEMRGEEQGMMQFEFTGEG